MFKIGDLVKLKSGGPIMTVSWIDGESCYCTFFTSDMELKEVKLQNQTLKAA